MIFITRQILWRYRVPLPGFELPETLHSAQEEFDNRLASALDGMADRMEGDRSIQRLDLSTAYAQLTQAAWRALPKDQHQLTPHVESFLLLSRRIETLTETLEKEI
jgi:hypothetical protein